MKIILTDEQFESLYDLIINDTEFLDYIIFMCIIHLYGYHSSNKIYRTSEDEHSEIYYGSLYGTKARITMMILRL